jgi:hypothetical protein
MAIAVTPVLPARPISVEQRMLIQGVSWKDYVILSEALDTPGLRMTYCEGMLELMTVSLGHEADKKSIARLVELYAFGRLRLNGYGSTTFRRRPSMWCGRTSATASGATKEGEFPTSCSGDPQQSVARQAHVYAGFGA